MATIRKGEQIIKRIIAGHHRPCRGTKSFLAKNRLRVPLIADMLQVLPCDSQRDLIARYGKHIPQVEKKLFDTVAGEWFSTGAGREVQGRFRLIADLKEMLTGWGFHSFYEKHKKRISFNVNEDLVNTLNTYYCLEELLESQINKAHETPKAGKPKGRTIAADEPGDLRLAMMAETSRTFFITAILNIQLKWMLELMNLAYLDGSMKASLDSEEYENFDKMQQAVRLSSIDELVDMIEMFPPHTSVESISALRTILREADGALMQKIDREKKKLLDKR